MFKDVSDETKVIFFGVGCIVFVISVLVASVIFAQVAIALIENM